MQNATERLNSALTEAAAPEGAIKLRFDAGRIASEPIIYACVSAEDLSLIPTDELSILGIGADISDIGGDPIFFVGDEASLELYVDLDAYPNFQSELAGVAMARGLSLSIARGDWATMVDAQGEFIAPDVPGFVRKGFEKVPPATALHIIDGINADRRIAEYDQGPK